MKISMIKSIGGALNPADEHEAEKLKKFKNFCMYEIDIKLARNPQFHGLVFAFFKFCYEHWDGQTVYEHLSDAEQFERFRKDLTILAGFYVQTVRLNGEIRTEAKSLAFGAMTEEEFKECYTALINAACKHIFRSCDENTYNRLLSFF